MSKKEGQVPANVSSSLSKSGAITHYILLWEAKSGQHRVICKQRPKTIPLDTTGYTMAGMPPMMTGEYVPYTVKGELGPEKDFDREEKNLDQIVEDWRGAELLKQILEHEELAKVEWTYIRFFVLEAGKNLPAETPNSQELMNRESFSRTSKQVNFKDYREAVISHQAAKVARSRCSLIVLGTIVGLGLGASVYFLSQLILAASQGASAAISDPASVLGVVFAATLLFAGLLIYQGCECRKKKKSYLHLSAFFQAEELASEQNETLQGGS